ncbi:MAG: response regulator, partial [Opitutus sp.]
MKSNLAHPSTGTTTDPFAKSRVFLVDDHPITRQGLVSLINREHNLVVCGEADSAPVAIEQIQKTNPDIALVDV